MVLYLCEEKLTNPGKEKKDKEEDRRGEKSLVRGNIAGEFLREPSLNQWSTEVLACFNRTFCEVVSILEASGSDAC